MDGRDQLRKWRMRWHFIGYHHLIDYHRMKGGKSKRVLPSKLERELPFWGRICEKICYILKIRPEHKTRETAIFLFHVSQYHVKVGWMGTDAWSLRIPSIFQPRVRTKWGKFDNPTQTKDKLTFHFLKSPGSSTRVKDERYEVFLSSLVPAPSWKALKLALFFCRE